MGTRFSQAAYAVTGRARWVAAWLLAAGCAASGAARNADAPASVRAPVEAASVAGPEAVSDSDTVTVTESDSDPGTATDSVTESGTVTDSVTESGTDPGTESATVTGTESGTATGSEVAALLALGPERSTSVGAPDFGELRGGVQLPLEGPGFRHNPRRPDEARWGTIELVQAIVRAAAVVEHELPGSGLVVNDLGLEHGGPIRQHGSHQAGRDADILFYALDRGGEPLPAVGVPLDPAGEGWDFKDLAVPGDDVFVRLDAPRTWRFVQALLEVAGEHVQRIFMVEHVRTLLLAEAKRVKAPTAIRQRFELVTCQPGTPHDDHMHVRFYCAPDDIAAGCTEKAPIYPWHREALAALELEPVRAVRVTRAQRKAAARRTTTPAQARKKAGRMHRKVRAFLDRREAWLPKPSPGRPYCR